MLLLKKLCTVLASFFTVIFLNATLVSGAELDHIVVMISVDGLSHYYLDDPKAEMPTIRRLAAEGARAQMMKASMPTVTWPNHTTLVTGVNPARHAVIGNSFWDREKETIISLLPDPLLNKEEIVKSPTIYDIAKEAGLKTAALIWPASRGAKTLDWTVPDVATRELAEQYATHELLTEFSQAGIPWEMQEEWWKLGKGRNRDKMFVQMLIHVMRHHQPNLGLLHLVELDHVEHAKGPQSPEAYATVKFEDERVEEVWDALKKYYPGRATLLVVSDHGFFPYQQQILPNVLLRQEGLLTVEGSKITGGQVRAVAQGGSSFIYILDQANRDSLMQRLVPKFREIEGMDVVITPQEYARYGMADPSKDSHMADLVLSAKSGYAMFDTANGDVVVTPKRDEVKGMHGYSNELPGMYATFVAWGERIKAGARLGTIENTSVAPTIATLLNLKMEVADGPVLSEILTLTKPR